MKQILLITLLLSLTTGFSQDDLDDIFDDGDKDSKLHVGTEFLTFAGGTPNVYIDYTPFDLVTLKVGVGFMPFHKQIDAVLFREHEITIDNISSGRFYDLNIKFNTQPSDAIDFKYYYYVGYKKWSYNYLEDIAVKRTKASFGVGYDFGLIGRFNLDLKFGIQGIFGSAKTNFFYTTNHDATTYFLDYGLSDNLETQKSMHFGVDLGVGISYSL